jgi:lipid II:glycine glycyltransferase (peptidoglycan interpeptide bridge formation enzyme)
MATSRPPSVAGAQTAQAERWAEWDRFVAEHPHGGFMQSSAWIRCRTDDGYGHIAVMLREEDGRLAGGAIVGRWPYGDNQAFYYIQEGPLLPEEPELAEAVLNALLARLQQHRRNDAALVSHLRIEPRRPDWPPFAAAGFEPPWRDDRFREPRYTLCVDLRGSEAERLQSMKPKGRYNVGLARRHGVNVVEDNSGRGWNDFLAIGNDTARRQDLKRRSRRYFAVMRREFGPRAQPFFAECAGRRLATALVIRFGDRATYLYGGSRDEQREVMAPYLLHHEIMNRMAAAGCICYDLWGVAPPTQPAHPWAGISAFKRKFGGAEVAHVPTLDHIYDRAAYGRFVATEAKPEREADHAAGPSGAAAAGLTVQPIAELAAEPGSATALCGARPLTHAPSR